MNTFAKYFATFCFGALVGAWIFAFQVAWNSFDINTVFGKVTCFKLK